jgi:hypothetical protein
MRKKYFSGGILHALRACGGSSPRVYPTVFYHSNITPFGDFYHSNEKANKKTSHPYLLEVGAEIFCQH